MQHDSPNTHRIRHSSLCVKRNHNPWCHSTRLGSFFSCCRLVRPFGHAPSSTALRSNKLRGVLCELLRRSPTVAHSHSAHQLVLEYCARGHFKYRREKIYKTPIAVGGRVIHHSPPTSRLTNACFVNTFLLLHTLNTAYSRTFTQWPTQGLPNSTRLVYFSMTSGSFSDRVPQRIVALAKDGRSPSSQPSRPSVVIQLAPEDGRISTSSESGISYVSCDDWRSSPPPAYSSARPPHYSPVSPLSEPPQTVRREKSTSAFTRKLAGFFAPNETGEGLDGLMGDFIHPKQPKGETAADAPLEIAVEVVQEEWTTGGRNGNGTRRASRFTFGGRDRNGAAEPPVQSS